MWLEREYAGRHPEAPGRTLQLGQHRLVAEMHAVKIAYGERGRARGRGGDPARESHTTKPEVSLKA
jgi:hypothetical protein